MFFQLFFTYRVPETGRGGDNSVFKIAAKLQQLYGYSVFVAEGNIQVGDNWTNAITHALRNCEAVVVMCSETYGDDELSPWTGCELAMAANAKKLLLPVWHSGPYPPQAAELVLSNKHRVPIGNTGYVEANISHERIAKDLAFALMKKGILPLGQPQR